MLIVLAGLIGGVVWNLFTWLLGLPSSSSPVAAAGTWLIYRVTVGVAQRSFSAAVILTSSHLGFALSTTHVATGSILGSGVGKPGGQVRWRVAGRMVAAWLITLPAAAIVGALMWFLGDAIGGLAGALVIVVVLIAAALFMYLRSRRTPVGPARHRRRLPALRDRHPRRPAGHHVHRGERLRQDRQLRARVPRQDYVALLGCGPGLGPPRRRWLAPRGPAERGVN